MARSVPQGKSDRSVFGSEKTGVALGSQNEIGTIEDRVEGPAGSELWVSDKEPQTTLQAI